MFFCPLSLKEQSSAEHLDQNLAACFRSCGQEPSGSALSKQQVRKTASCERLFGSVEQNVVGSLQRREVAASLRVLWVQLVWSVC